MKNFWIFFLCLSIHKLIYSQQDTLRLSQVYDSFSNSEKAEWTAFKNNWNYFDYTSIKQKFNVAKLDCKKCESFYADIFIEINENGKISFSKLINGKKCGITCKDDNFEEEFKKSLQKQQFNYLKNKQFIARFGHILKC